MSKFDFLNGYFISLRPCPVSLLTLGGLLSITSSAHDSTVVWAIYNGKEKAVMMRWGLRFINGEETIGLEAKNSGYLMTIGLLRRRTFLAPELKQQLDSFDRFDDLEMNVTWYREGALYVSGVDINKHYFEGIYLNLVKKAADPSVPSQSTS